MSPTQLLTSAIPSIVWLDGELPSTNGTEHSVSDTDIHVQNLLRDDASAIVRTTDPRLGRLVRALYPSAHTLRDVVERVSRLKRPSAQVLKRVEKLDLELTRMRALSLEAELRELVSAVGIARVGPVLRQLGWDGAGGCTLQLAGEEEGITRERVRQLVEKVRLRLDRNTFAPALRRALGCLTSRLTPAPHVEQTWLASGITEKAFLAEGVITAASIIRPSLKLRISIVDGRRFVVDERSEKAVQAVRKIARANCRRWTVMSLLDLGAKYRAAGGDIDLDLATVVEGMAGFGWLDRAAGWFWIRGDRSRLLNTIRKVVSVAGKLSVSELRAGVSRHYRMHGFAPPKHVLAALCIAAGGYRVEGNTVIADPPLEWTKVLDGVEKTLIEVLRASGSVMPRDELERQCMAAGMNRSTFYVYLGYSPVITRYAPGVYGVRGSELEPSAIEVLRSRPRKHEVLQDHGWRKERKPWIGYRLSESTLISGIVTIPANMKRFISGVYSLISEDGEKFGELRCHEGRAWGLRPIVERRGLEVGDFLMLTISEKDRSAVVDYGTEEPWEVFDAEPAAVLGRESTLPIDRDVLRQSAIK